uniref:Mitochondrial import inner membrane translocase subunit TIM50 n=1 Tax=Parascaris univalens TaxID=6257 RepID=A0A915CE81_PARUN
MKSVGEFRLKESPILATHGFRRLDSKSLFMDISLCGSPLSQLHHLSNAANSFETWQRLENTSGMMYYWSPQNSNSSVNKNSDVSSHALSSSRNTYFANGTAGGTYLKVMPTGYAPNRFPLSTSYTCDPPDEQLSSCYSLSASTSGGGISDGAVETSSPSSGAALVSSSTVYSSAGAAYTNIASVGSSSSLSYFGEPSALNVEYTTGYENVPRNSYSSRTFQSRGCSERQAFQRVQPRKEDGIISSSNNVVGYFTPPPIVSNEKNTAVCNNEYCSFQRDAQLVWTICGKQQVSGEGKQTPTVHDGSSRSSVSRDKPRVPKFLHSLCCCVRAESAASREKRRAIQGSAIASASSLITQVKKNSLNVTVLNGNAGTNDSYTADDSDAAESMPMQPAEKLLLPPLRACDATKKCLIIDLDETLVHSSFKPVKNADFVIPVEIDNVTHQVYVLKRPFVDEFLERIGDKFECVLFTASLAKVGLSSIDMLFPFA